MRTEPLIKRAGDTSILLGRDTIKGKKKSMALADALFVNLISRMVRPNVSQNPGQKTLDKSAPGKEQRPTGINASKKKAIHRKNTAGQDPANRLSRWDRYVLSPAMTPGDLYAASSSVYLPLQNRGEEGLAIPDDPSSKRSSVRRKAGEKGSQSPALVPRSGHTPSASIRKLNSREAVSASIKEMVPFPMRLSSSKKSALVSDGTHRTSLHASSGEVPKTDSPQVLTAAHIHSDLMKLVNGRQVHLADSPSANGSYHTGPSVPDRLKLIVSENSSLPRSTAKTGKSSSPGTGTLVMAQTILNEDKHAEQLRVRTGGVIKENYSVNAAFGGKVRSAEQAMIPSRVPKSVALNLKEPQAMKVSNPVSGDHVKVDATPQGPVSTAFSGSAARSTPSFRKREIIADPLMMRQMSPAEQFAVFSNSQPAGTARSVSSQIAQQLADWMGKASFHLTREAVKRLTITLFPQNLGQVTVTVTQSDDGIVAHLMTRTKAARELIHSGLDQLRSDIASQGILLNQLDVSRQWPGHVASEADLPGQGEADQNAQGQANENEEQKKKKRSGNIDTDGTTTTFLNWLKGGV
jgi:flagellar hook-length control protein FliK